MLIDIYGSRSNLMSLLSVNTDTNIVVSNIFIGTTIESQNCKEMKINEERMNDITSPYELIELHTDMSKRLRKFNNYVKSNVIILDFLHEGRESIKFKNGTLVNRPVLRRYGYSQGDGHVLSLDNKIKNIEKYVNDLINYIKPYDLVIINKLRNPKWTKDDNQRSVKVDDLESINFLNYYAETFEDVLASKKKDIRFIPEYKPLNQLEKGYQNNSDYLKFLENHLDNILKEEN